MNIEEIKVIPEDLLFLFPVNYKDLCKPSASSDTQNRVFGERTVLLSPIQNENSRLEFQSYYKNISRF